MSDALVSSPPVGMGLLHEAAGATGRGGATLITKLLAATDALWERVDAGLGPSAVVVPCAFACWAGLYALTCLANRNLKVQDWAGWNIRIVAFAHAMVLLALSARSTFFTGPWAFDGIGAPNTPLQAVAAQVSLGYFLFDVCWCVAHKSETLLTLLHHASCVTSYLLMLAYGVSGTEVISVAAGSEITNPSLQTRWFLMQAGEYDTWLGAVNDWLFAFSFGLARLGYGSALLVHVWASPRTPLPIKLGGTALYAISVVWFYHIARMFVGRYVLRSRPSRRRRAPRPTDSKDA